MKALQNARGVKAVTVDSKPYVMIAGPVHGPISCDEALEWAAWLIHYAAPHSRLKVAAMLKQIETESKRKP